MKTSAWKIKTYFQSIRLAHEDLNEGDILYNSGDLLDASANRSPYAYEQNPAEERARWRNNIEHAIAQYTANLIKVKVRKLMKKKSVRIHKRDQELD